MRIAKAKWIEAERCDSLGFSTGAYGLFMNMAIYADPDNKINKPNFIKRVKLIKDYRTWNKYWSELVDKKVLVQLDKKVWMLSPHMCYTDGATHSTLINIWNEAINDN